MAQRGPAAHGWSDDQVWAASRVRTLIGRKFHISYSVSGATRLLHRVGYSVQMPDRPAAERDEEAVAMWREVTWAIPIGAVLVCPSPARQEAPEFHGCRPGS
ncbi:winged helix-turn-helix domain-containing protein [Streptomyces sp. NEAU-YJ-81]|uniref:helix-turn-helix domain-containing protein n=1 Tax=Streptomyces sp. NEAU-YJ-81 TaxID=2820288 RepID=UPI0027DEDE35|nr:winged helix-turn-helix domain-containing protein [Streptomyces sp. NEAU-YJ-81]